MKINNYNYIISSIDFDIIHRVRIDLNEEITKSSELIFENNGVQTRIKFELGKGNKIDESDFLFIPETNILFYRGYIEWCAFDLTNKIIIRSETATQLPYIERRKDVIIVFDEMYAESMDLMATLINNVPIDPPTETIEYDDRIEFDSIVFGKQTLKLVK